MPLRFGETESAFDYMMATREYLEQHGQPLAFYSDKASVFRINNSQATGGDGLTQFGRAMNEQTSPASVPTPVQPVGLFPLGLLFIIIFTLFTE